MIDIGSRIKARRERLGWSTRKLAMLAEVHQSTLTRVENGRGRFSEEDLFKVAGALSVSVDKLYAPEGNVVAVADDFRRIPVLDYVQAGKWTVVQDSLNDTDIRETISTNLEVPPSTFAMRIRGNSMEPTFHEGDMVVIAPPISPKPGDFVVAVDETGDATFKRYREAGMDAAGNEVFELVALNPDYATMRSDRMKISIVGTMIEHRTYRRR